MLSVAGYRYRNVLESEGAGRGAARIFGLRSADVSGKRLDKVVSRRKKFALYSDADGTGTSETPMVARYMAISETMERWAYRVKVRANDRELYGFDIDESSNGMAAFPGLFHTEARKRALLEAVERVSTSWWARSTARHDRVAGH